MVKLVEHPGEVMVKLVEHPGEVSATLMMGF
jgi:hypothetical protein